MNLLKLIMFILLFLTKICTGAVKPVIQPVNVHAKQIGGLRMLQSYEIQNFMSAIGCDIEVLWDDCIDQLYKKDKSESDKEKNVDHEKNSKIYNSKVLRDKLINHISKLTNKVSNIFDKNIKSINSKDIFEINNQNLNTFLENYKLRNSKARPAQWLSLEFSTLAADSIKKHVIKIQNPNNLSLLDAIKKIVLSYFDLNSLVTRLDHEDETVFDIPATPVIIQCYDDNSIEIYGLPEMRQDVILTEHSTFIEESQCSLKHKFLTILLIATEFAAIYTAPLYQATVHAIYADAYQKHAILQAQQEKIDLALKTLELNPEATQQEIHARYRQMSLVFHPDKPTGNVKKFMEITEAYKLLKKI